MLDAGIDQIQTITNQSLDLMMQEQPQQRLDNRKAKKRAPSNKRGSPSKDGVSTGMDKEGS